MQVIKTILRLFVFFLRLRRYLPEGTLRIYISLSFLPVFSYSQSTLLPQGNKFQPLLDRMEIKRQSDVLLNTSSVAKPYNRRIITTTGDSILSSQVSPEGDPVGAQIQYTPVDIYNIERLLMNNQEWVAGDKSRYASKRPWGKAFYQTPSDFIQVNVKDFFLVVNPVVNMQLSKEQDNGENIFLNSKGLTGRGLIAGKVGFDFYVADNQERTPLFVKARVNEHRAVPGAGFYKSFKTTAYDYFDARGSVYFTASKYINLQFGYDKNFIGNGYRSLFLSD
ncbi:MAG TPA: hypothetical protein VJ647_04180, partial [Chitinophagaceae bacterium]|nr:hypothetical protein [Chitinophagaceae bacterium]